MRGKGRGERRRGEKKRTYGLGFKVVCLTIWQYSSSRSGGLSIACCITSCTNNLYLFYISKKQQEEVGEVGGEKKKKRARRERETKKNKQTKNQIHPTTFCL